MPRRAGTGNNGKLQATVLKKCDHAYHRPETNKQCAAGTCQHTCEPSAIERCRHAWTVRYTVNGVQRDKSFKDEMDDHKRVQVGSGLKKAQDFQLELTRGKRAQGKTYVDPRAGNELFGPAAEAFIMSSAGGERGLACHLRQQLPGQHQGPVSRAARWPRWRPSRQPRR